MKRAVAKLRSISPYSQSRHYDVPKLNKEQPKAYEERTWRERCHATPEGNVFIPPMAFKNCLADIAKFLGEKIPGKRNATWSKHFLSGILCMDNLILPQRKEDITGEWLFVPSNGIRGGGSRVDKCFPVIHEWSGDATFYVLDELIDEQTFKYHLQQAGQFIGIGRFRPQSGGFYGRFVVDSLKWEDWKAE